MSYPKTFFLLGIFLLPIFVSSQGESATEPILFFSSQNLIVTSRIKCEISYVFDSTPLAEGDVISIQLPNFWEKPVLEPTGSNNALIETSVSSPLLRYKTSLSKYGIDGYTYESGVTVINFEILKTIQPLNGTKITFNVGAEPLENRGIGISRFAGEQRVYCAIYKKQGEYYTLIRRSYSTINVLPRSAKKLFACLPNRISPEEKPVVKVSFLDEYGNRDIAKHEKVVFKNSTLEVIGETFADSGFALMALNNSTLKPIDSILVTSQSGMSIWTNPCMRTAVVPSKIWWGDLHSHCIYSDHGTGFTNDLVTYAQKSSLLDYVAYMEHDFIDAESQLRATSDINKGYLPGRFVAFNGIEWSSRISNNAAGHGHISVLSAGSEPIVRFNTTSLTRPDYVMSVARQNNYLLAINHPMGPSSFDFDYFDNRIMRNIEMVSDGYIGVLSNEFNPANLFGSSVNEIIRKQYRLGFLGASDNHYAQPGRKSNDYTRSSGLTAIIADTLTRESLFNALSARHNYATTGARIMLDVRIGTAMMGDVLNAYTKESEKLSIKVSVVGTAKLSKVELVKNGITERVFSNIGSKVFDMEWPLTIDLESCGYYIRVTQVDGEMAWSSPIWLNMDSLDENGAEGTSESTFNVKVQPFQKDVFRFLFSMKSEHPVTMIIYDILGRQIRTFADLNLTSGLQEVYWNTDNDMGAKVNSGVFFARIDSPFGVKTLKLAVIR